MENFDWVSARDACSVTQMFERLRLAVDEDVKVRQALRKKVDDFGFEQGFEFTTRGSSFSVSRRGIERGRAVVFAIQGRSITVKDESGNLLRLASVTINDDKECVLVVGEEQLQEWQFRKKSLEAIFFGD